MSIVADGTEVVVAKDEFDVTFADTLPRPWIYARVLPEPSDSLYARLIGLQLFNLGKFEESQGEHRGRSRAKAVRGHCGGPGPDPPGAEGIRGDRSPAGAVPQAGEAGEI